MALAWRTLAVLLAVGTSLAIKICELRDERVFCQCDGYETNKVRTVTCNFILNVTGEDHIWEGFEEQRMVESLSLNGRGDGSVTSVPTRAFELAQRLQEIMFTSNRLGVLRSYSFTKMEQLSRLDLENNEITGLQDHTFNNLPNLTTLVLSVNNIRVLPPSALQHLQNLREIFLDRNELEIIKDHAFQHLHGLRELDLNSNKISHISSKTFVGLRALHRLDLSRNSLASLTDRIFRSSPNLEDLDLSRNRITEITPHAFDGLKRLVKLSLKDNKLFSLQKTVFKGAPHLIQIHLGDNKLVTLQKHILDPLVNVSNPEFVIFLKGNPFVCRCDMLWISGFVNNSKTHTESLGLKKELRSMKCSFADHRKSTPVAVVDLRRDEMTCPDPPISRPSPVYHAPPPLHPVYNNPPQSTPEPSSSSTRDQFEDVFAQTEVNHVEIREELDDDLATTVRAPVVRATVNVAAKGQAEAKNIELADAAETNAAESKHKTALKKEDTNAASTSTSSELIMFLFAFLQLALACLGA